MPWYYTDLTDSFQQLPFLNFYHLQPIFSLKKTKQKIMEETKLSAQSFLIVLKITLSNGADYSLYCSDLL